MSRYFLLIAVLLVAPVKAAELGDSYVKLFDIQLKLAKKGDAGAQYSVGEMYEQGMGATKSKGEAFRWYHSAAAQGDIRAIYKLKKEKQKFEKNAQENEPTAQEPAKSTATQALAQKKKAKLERAKKRKKAKAALEKQRKQVKEDEIGW
ncbi:MAG: hypothetical protein BMS9Abin33_0577 [Gammaproteobacteria bacterium]|nr:MAG: hypothetical protein BMS9Abin33_0577 [Gammaproteobacteria bacterium]